MNGFALPSGRGRSLSYLKCFTIYNAEEILPTIKSAMEVDGPSLIEFKMSLELNTSTTTISQLQTN